jgi:hypothetical protein
VTASHSTRSRMRGLSVTATSRRQADFWATLLKVGR